MEVIQYERKLNYTNGLINSEDKEVMVIPQLYK